MEQVAGGFPVRVLVVLLATAVAAMTLAGCGGSGTEELTNDPADVTVAGPPPTAPSSTVYDGAGLSSEGTELLKQLDSLANERDLCTVIGGEAIKPLLAGDFDAGTLVTSPSGVTPMLNAVETLFSHLVDISPPEIQPATAVIRDAWKAASAMDAGSADRREQTDSIMSQPDVVDASRSLAAWIQQNCALAGAVPGLGG